MTERRVVCEELGRLFNALSHPDRIRIVEELAQGELNVNELEQILEVSHSRVSQHLQVLRSHYLVEARKQGRCCYYHLVDPELARWLLQGMDFLGAEFRHTDRIRSACRTVRKIWEEGEPAEEHDPKVSSGGS